MDWNIVTLPCNKVRLGISRLTDLNIALVSKWFYKYGNEREFLEKGCMCKKWLDLARMLPIINRSTRKSSLFDLIGSMMDGNDEASSLVRQGFRPLIGNGINVDFRSDN